jgi:hypothetical protein
VHIGKVDRLKPITLQAAALLAGLKSEMALQNVLPFIL